MGAGGGRQGNSDHTSIRASGEASCRALIFIFRKSGSSLRKARRIIDEKGFCDVVYGHTFVQQLIEFLGEVFTSGKRRGEKKSGWRRGTWNPR